MRQSFWSVILLVKEKLRRLGSENATRSKVSPLHNEPFRLDHVLQKMTLWTIFDGDVAQMVERPLRMREVGGSIPSVSIAFCCTA